MVRTLDEFFSPQKIWEGKGACEVFSNFYFNKPCLSLNRQLKCFFLKVFIITLYANNRHHKENKYF